MINGPVFCEGCTSTIDGRLVVYVLPSGGYICDDCVHDLERQEGIEVLPSDDWKQRHQNVSNQAR